jgi:aryl-alcohol dehydrogenase-like predicted oxidoreductase
MDHSKPHPALYGVPWITEEFNGMPYRLMGQSGLRVSNVGLGTWKVGYPETGDGARVNEQTALKIFDKALELGVTFWDTANRYNNASGNSERIIGTWLKNNPDQRRNIVLATKVFGGMDGVSPNHSRLSRSNILESVYACIERLGIDCIDILYFHAYDAITPVEESLAAIEDLIRQDLVRYFGVSNYTIDQIKSFQEAEKSFSIRTRIITVQNQFDIINGELANYPDVLDYCAQLGISFVAETPLAYGLLTDRYLDLSKIGPGDRLYDEGNLEKYATEKALDKVRKLAELAKESGIKVNQLAMAYMLTLPGMGPIIPSASSIEHLESNAQAGKIVLTGEQVAKVKGILA